MNDMIEQIPLDDIEPFPGNRRIGGFDSAKLEQLAESIRAVSVQQPAVVRKVNQHLDQDGRLVQYQLVAGERRWRASRIAGKDTLPCIVRELDDVTAMKIQYIENLQRDDIHPLDESVGYAQLVERAGYTIETLASEVGKSISYVYQRMKLSSLIPEAQELFIEGNITAGHAILIARLSPKHQAEIVNDNLFDYDDDVIPVRELDSYIHNHIMLDLSESSWKIDDADLIPGTGSCRECPKRTGYQPALFADVCKSNKDYCTDRSCFKMKSEAIVEQKRVELVGEKVIEVIDGYTREEFPDNVLPSWAWNECKKKTPGAQKVLIVGGDTPGRITYGIIRSSNMQRHQPSPIEKEKAKKEKLKEKAAEDLRISKLDAILQAAEDQGPTLPIEALRLCVLNVWRRWWHDHVVLIAKHEKWNVKNGEAQSEGEKRIKTMNEYQLNRMLLLMTTISEIKCPTYSKPSTKTIDEFTKIYSDKTSKAPVGKAKKKGSVRK